MTSHTQVSPLSAKPENDGLRELLSDSQLSGVFASQEIGPIEKESGGGLRIGLGQKSFEYSSDLGQTTRGIGRRVQRGKVDQFFHARVLARFGDGSSGCGKYSNREMKMGIENS